MTKRQTGAVQFALSWISVSYTRNHNVVPKKGDRFLQQVGHKAELPLFNLDLVILFTKFAIK